MSHTIRVFLCDDDEDEVLFLDSALQSLKIGFELQSFLSCSEMFNSLQVTMDLPDIIILDLKMPDESGLECLHRLKSQPRLKNIPVIIHSTSALVKDIDGAYQNGASCYLLKTGSEWQFQQNLFNILNLKRDDLLNPSRENFFVQPEASKQQK
jgi:CheY-like chemotaxis protein